MSGGDFARVVAMPVEYSSYKNLEGTDADISDGGILSRKSGNE